MIETRLDVVLTYFFTDRRSGLNTGQYDSFRKRPKDDLLASRSYSTDRGRVGYEKRRSWSPDDYGSSLNNFRPVTLTVSSFFKQVFLLFVIMHDVNFYECRIFSFSTFERPWIRIVHLNFDWV